MERDDRKSCGVDAPAICGWMEKEGRNQMKSWKRRWFELDTSNFSLKYYVDSSKQSHKGDFNIMTYTVVSDIVSGKRSHMFSVTTDDNRGTGADVLVLSAASADEKLVWMESITAVVARRRLLSCNSVSAISIGGVWMEGWLEKEGGSIKTWKKRWICLECRLNGFVISYFEDQKKKKKKGEIPITKKSTVSSLDDGFHDTKRNLFSLVTSDHEARHMLIMSAPSPTAKAQWIVAIQSAIQTYQDIQVPVADFKSSCAATLGTFYSGLARGEVSTLDILTDDFTSTGTAIHTKSSLGEQMKSWRGVVQDLQWDVEEMLVDGSRVAVRCLVQGSPTGDFLGATGLDGSRKFSITAIDLHTIEGGRIQRRLHVEDWLSASQQLRAFEVPSAVAARPPLPAADQGSLDMTDTQK